MASYSYYSPISEPSSSTINNSISHDMDFNAFNERLAKQMCIEELQLDLEPLKNIQEPTICKNSLKKTKEIKAKITKKQEEIHAQKILRSYKINSEKECTVDQNCCFSVLLSLTKNTQNKSNKEPNPILDSREFTLDSSQQKIDDIGQSYNENNNDMTPVAYAISSNVLIPYHDAKNSFIQVKNTSPFPSILSSSSNYEFNNNNGNCPFKAKTTEELIEIEKKQLECPFKPKTIFKPSPISKPTEQNITSNFNNCPFTVKHNFQNNPIKPILSSNTTTASLNNNSCPFKPKHSYIQQPNNVNTAYSTNSTNNFNISSKLKLNLKINININSNNNKFNSNNVNNANNVNNVNNANYDYYTPSAVSNANDDYNFPDTQSPVYTPNVYTPNNQYDKSIYTPTCYTPNCYTPTPYPNTNNNQNNQNNHIEIDFSFPDTQPVNNNNMTTNNNNFTNNQNNKNIEIDLSFADTPPPVSTSDFYKNNKYNNPIYTPTPYPNNNNNIQNIQNIQNNNYNIQTQKNLKIDLSLGNTPPPISTGNIYNSNTPYNHYNQSNHNNNFDKQFPVPDTQPIGKKYDKQFYNSLFC